MRPREPSISPDPVPGGRLVHLAAREADLHAEVVALDGTPPERFQRLHDREVFARYRGVFEAYATLAAGQPGADEPGATPDDATEALKRATFLQWSAAAEPRERTGLWRLDEEAQDEVIRELDRRIQTGELDDELRFMLGWYFAQADFYFDSLEEGHALKALLREARDEAPVRIEDPPEALRRTDRRGRMGMYFAEMLAAAGGA